MNVQPVHLRINDAATGQPTPVRLRITDAAGAYYAPFGRLTEFATGVNQDVGGNVQIGAKKWAYIDGACEILLPPGKLHVEISKGFEYKPIDEEITLLAGKMSLRFTIERWCDMRKEGWYSGDTRVHFMSPDAALLEGQAEDVAVVNLLACETKIKDDFGQSFSAIPNILSFSGQSFARQTDYCGVAVGTRNAMRGLYDSVGFGLLHCHRVVYPSTLDVDDDNWTAEDWCDQCHRKKGLVVSANISPLSIGASTDYLTWEPLACMILGKLDALEIPSNTCIHWAKLSPLVYLFGWYYELFDAEIMVSLVGTSGKKWNRSLIGDIRTYAFLPPDEKFTYASWIEAVRDGRTFATNGPLIHYTINGEVPSRNFKVPANSNPLQIRAQSTSPAQYHNLELVWNGKVVQSAAPDPAFPFRAELSHELAVNKGGWLALRCTSDPEVGPVALDTMLHTSPVAVRLEGSPCWANPDVVRTLLGRFDEVIAWTRTRTQPPRPRLIKLYEEARTILAKKLSNQGGN